MTKIIPDDPRSRCCHKCQKWFNSLGKGNHRCPKCEAIINRQEHRQGCKIIELVTSRRNLKPGGDC